MQEPIEFPIPEFDDMTIMFGAKDEHYLTREQLGDWYNMNNKTPFHKAFSGLFFKGGTLADHGLKWKDEIDQEKAMRALRALMCSFEPKHEIKTGTVAVALANWCDVI